MCQKSNRTTKVIEDIYKIVLSFERREKVEAEKMRSTRARNEYILCVKAANAGLHKVPFLPWLQRGLHSVLLSVLRRRSLFSRGWG